MTQHSNKKIVIITTLAALIMFGFSFAMSPLYRVVCKKTGLNGGVNVAEVRPNAQQKFYNNQAVKVQFLAINNANLPWEFYPDTTEVTVQPEKIIKIIFHAKNNSHQTMTVQAVPSFSPSVAAQYFHKIECFCFTQQTLAPGEAKEMPVVFRLDSQLPLELHTITLAYTLFDVKRTAS